MQENQTPPDEDTQQPCKKQKIRESAKTTWFITYASGSTDITHEILLSYSLECTECHTVTWRESKYTLVHLTKRIRSSALQKIMLKMRTDHNIIDSIIEGYETLASTVKGDSDSSMEEHPGFKRMIHLLDKDHEEMRSWMKLGTIKTNKSGIFWRYITSIDPHSMSRAQLVHNTKKLSALTEEHTKLKKAHEALQGAYAAQANELRIARTQNEDFYTQLCQKISECGALKRQLIQKK